MNFLAHLFLTKDQTEGVILGNFMADAVKGTQAITAYGEEIRLGIRIHREIDDFTDKHRLFRQGTRRLHQNYGKFAAIILDMFYDHMLAKMWNRYSELPLQEFAETQYSLIDRHLSILPVRTKMWFGFMKNHNLLVTYSEEESMSFVFRRMDHRTGGISGMSAAMKDFREHEENFSAEFKQFFSEIQQHIAATFFSRDGQQVPER